jgi:hypothetical protein
MEENNPTPVPDTQKPHKTPLIWLLYYGIGVYALWLIFSYSQSQPYFKLPTISQCVESCSYSKPYKCWINNGELMGFTVLVLAVTKLGNRILDTLLGRCKWWKKLAD